MQAPGLARRLLNAMVTELMARATSEACIMMIRANVILKRAATQKTHRRQYLTIAEPLFNCGYPTAGDRPGAGAAAQGVPGAAMATHARGQVLGVRAGPTYQQ